MGRKNKSLPVEKVLVQKLVHGGQGLGIMQDGRKCFVWGALPNEEVMVQLTKHKKEWAEGYAVEIIVPSKDRVEPEEPDMYLATSPWQILDYKKEAAAKQQILSETFEREGLAINWQEFYQQDEPYYYRNKMEYNFWFDTETNQVSLALHRRGSHQKVAVAGSVLASNAINAAGKELVAYINKNNIEARPLKSVILRSSADGMVGTSLFVNDKSIAKSFSKFEPANSIFEIMYSDPKSPASISTEVIKPAEQQLSDTVLNRNFSYTARSFFQVNIPVYEQALKIIADIVGASQQETVLDMYSGVGSIGLTVTPEGKHLVLVETDEESVTQAQQNIGNKKNVKIILAAAESALEHITGEELVIVDPPRAGLHKDVTEKLIEAKPKTIVYLSCNPSTQARDVKALLAAGYRVASTQGFNFFPRTPHIESLIILHANEVV